MEETLSDKKKSITKYKRSELGDFLRSRREKLSVKAVGLQSGKRRRTPGLRREEVAELARIGVDWYTRLEQGRTVSPSVVTINALARALRLNKVEHTHLRSLARNADRPDFSRESVPTAILRVLQTLPQPAYVTGRRWDVLAWNAAAAEIFTDFGQLAEEDRNVLVYMLTNSDTRRLFGKTWEDEANACWPTFVRRTIFGPPTQRFSTWWSAFDEAALSSRPGGRHTTYVAAQPAKNS